MKFRATIAALCAGIAVMSAATAQAVEPTTDKALYAQWELGSVVKVYVDPGVKGHGWDVASALQGWSAGPVKLKAVSAPCVGCITVREAPANDEWWGIADWQRVGHTMTQCDVRLAVDTKPRRRAFTVAHEIGHCLGLPHVNDRESIMDLWLRIPRAVPTEADLA